MSIYIRVKCKNTSHSLFTDLTSQNKICSQASNTSFHINFFLFHHKFCIKN